MRVPNSALDVIALTGEFGRIQRSATRYRRSAHLQRDALPASGSGFDPRSDVLGPQPVDHRRWIQTTARQNYLESLTNSRIVVIRDSHRGLGAVLNRGLELCQSEFLARMDADDLSWPRRLEQQLTFLHRRPDVGMLGTQFEYIAGHRKPVLSPSLPCDHATIMGELLQGNLAMVHALAAFRTAALRQIGGYRILGMGEDWDIFPPFGRGGTLANHQPFYSYRLHRGNSDINRFVVIIAWASSMLAIVPDCGSVDKSSRPRRCFARVCS